MAEKTDNLKGVDDFINASDEFYKYLASVLREEIKKESKDLERLRELSELVKINSASIKSQKDEKEKSKEPATSKSMADRMSKTGSG